MVLVMSVEPGFGGQKFMPAAVEKIAAIRAEAQRRGLSTDIEVDGGIDAATAPLCAAAGANVLVAGSAQRIPPPQCRPSAPRAYRRKPGFVRAGPESRTPGRSLRAAAGGPV